MWYIVEYRNTEKDIKEKARFDTKADAVRHAKSISRKHAPITVTDTHTGKIVFIKG